MAGNLQIGDVAPDFRLVAVGGTYGNGREVTLQEFRRRPVVLYFYPKDDTPGCTVQACGVRDAWAELQDAARVFGVSTDSIESHTRFIEKFRLPFPLLSDPKRQMVKAYGVWVEKNFMGRKTMGVERTTFVIDENGRIAAILRKVKPDEHVSRVKHALETSPKN